MDQSKLVSFIESMLNVFAGFFISWGMWVFVVAPMYGLDTNMGTALGITGIFTVTSLARSYLIRRYFNNGWNMAAVNIARKIMKWKSI